MVRLLVSEQARVTGTENDRIAKPGRINIYALAPGATMVVVGAGPDDIKWWAK